MFKKKLFTWLPRDENSKTPRAKIWADGCANFGPCNNELTDRRRTEGWGGEGEGGRD